ncbi:MAG: Zn-dependent hydrolase of the beta-lactamase fold-like protein [Bacteroidetes bacterium]|nr:Zn-dependent hydrolase of the beta-lactamase fold-like protein [Bacteroidota bacterium]
MFVLIVIIAVVIGFVFLYMQLPLFGQQHNGERLERIKKSPNYRDEQFHNQNTTPMLVSKKGMFSILWKKLFDEKPKGLIPKDKIPTIKTDLKSIPKDKDIVVWFGHSSYYIQIDGKRFLIDPVFSKHASPVPILISCFEGTNIYSVEDMPPIDYLLITHDHYDHLDYRTIKKLNPKIKQVICGLGVGSHLERWDYSKDKIKEMDWNETIELVDGFKINSNPTRHFSGRTTKRNNTLWLSFVLQTPSKTIFISGDGGYDSHFAEIGKKFEKIDFAFLELGQYNEKWKFIHSFPEQVLLEAKDLNAKKVLPIHWGKFALSEHNWKEPIEKLISLNKKENINILTPMIGEIIDLNNDSQVFSSWWENIE